jgi:DNA repair protein Crb2 Tudor domain/Agenet domain
MWEAGDRVPAELIWWYPARALDVEDDGLTVEYDDGDSAHLSFRQVMALNIAQGNRVFGRKQGGPTYHPGTVTARRGEEIHVRYDDGEEEWTTLSMVRVDRGAPAWEEGDRVLAHWPAEPSWWYPATVQSVIGDTIAVEYDDGDSAELSPRQVRALDLVEGSEVFARQDGNRYYVPATVLARRGEEVQVRYEDDEEEWAPLGMVRVNRGAPFPEEALRMLAEGAAASVQAPTAPAPAQGGGSSAVPTPPSTSQRHTSRGWLLFFLVAGALIACFSNPDLPLLEQTARRHLSASGQVEGAEAPPRLSFDLKNYHLFSIGTVTADVRGKAGAGRLIRYECVGAFGCWWVEKPFRATVEEK